MNQPTEHAGNGSGLPPEKTIFYGETVSITDEMKSAYLDYAMSVIVSRAIPDLRDGLKPVHRRILYAMHESGNTSDKPYRKSARPVGDVMGKYHPHGDGAIYDALVRMAQDFSMSLPLLDGQGNFGSMDGDNPAAMRYTEVRMAKVASSLLADIDRNTVDFQDNYDGKDREPSVLPARFPNLLVNGSGGIAVGMATSIPPHNLSEVIDAALAMINDPDISIERLIEHLPAPDFPTGGVIVGRMGAKLAYFTGRGKVVVRAKARIESNSKDRTAIVVDEIPYQVNKAKMVERIAEVAREKKIEGIMRVQDESDRTGVRVVVELKRDATPEVVMNQLWRFTPMQSSFACNFLALNGGRPEQLDLAKFLRAFLDFREDVVARRTADELRRARERSHLLCGLAVAVSNVDEVVAIIRSSSQPSDARQRLMARDWPAGEIEEYIGLIDDPLHPVSRDGTYRLSEAQARAILDLRLQRLTALGVKEITDELKLLAEKIRDFLAILRFGGRIREIVAGELLEIKERYGVPRRTEIVEVEDELEDEDFIEPEDMVVTVTNTGYIKRTPLAEYRAQKRGGKGLAVMATKEEDFVTSLHVANTHTALLFFTTDGMAYKLKTWRLPKAGRNSKGKAIVNILPIATGVSIAEVTPVLEPEEEWDKLRIVFANSEGGIRRNRLSDFAKLKSNGKIAMRLPEGVTLVGVSICTNDKDIMLATSRGNVIRFPASDVRIFESRTSAGVRGIKLKKNDKVVSMAVVDNFEASPEERSQYLKMRNALSRSNGEIDDAETESSEEKNGLELSQERFNEMQASEQLLLTVAVDGSGKISSSHNYPRKKRGGQGVAGLKSGEIVGFLSISLNDQIMLATDSGQSIRCPVKGISFRSRTAGGVRVFNTADNARIVSVACVAESDDVDDTVEAQQDEAVDSAGGDDQPPSN